LIYDANLCGVPDYVLAKRSLLGTVVFDKPYFAKPLESKPCPLRHRVYRYDDPFEPAVVVEDWEVLQ
jgi:hypothetical protein